MAVTAKQMGGGVLGEQVYHTEAHLLGLRESREERAYGVSSAQLIGTKAQECQWSG